MGQGRGSSSLSTPWGACVLLRARSALDGVSLGAGAARLKSHSAGGWPMATIFALSSAPSLRACGQQPTAHEMAVVSKTYEIRAARVSRWCPNHGRPQRPLRARRLASSARANPRSSPARSDWPHKVRHDGFRVLAWKQGERVKVWSRRGADFTDRLLSIAEEFAGSPQMSARGRGCGRVRQSLCSSVSKASCRSDRAASIIPAVARADSRRDSRIAWWLI